MTHSGAILLAPGVKRARTGAPRRLMRGTILATAAASRHDGAALVGRRGQVIESEGYIADVGYTAGFYPETAPGHLAFAAMAAGSAPGGAAAPARVLELGFGQGFGLALLAAANPDIAFEGCDFNAGHVAHARALIGAADLANLTVAQARFEDVAARGGKRDVDAVILHGVLSWVGPATQKALTAILRRRLRKAGALYVSYNCMPGWGPLAPIRRLVDEVGRSGGGGSETRIARALDLLVRLKGADARYFLANPAAARHLDAMLGMDRAYLAHEYLAEHWRAPPFAEVAALLDRAGLRFAASATLTENFDAFAAPANTRPLIAQTADPILREGLRDFAANRTFRRDLFLRDPPPPDAAAHRRSLGRTCFALAAPRGRIVFKFVGPLGELIGREDFYGPIVDRLAGGPTAFDELLALPAFGEAAVDRLVECLAVLIHSGQVLARAAPAPEDGAPARRFNRMVVDAARTGRLYGWLASPVARTGVRVDDFGLLTLAALFDGEAAPPEAAARRGLAVIAGLGRRPRDGGRALDDDGEALAFLAERMRPALEEDLPLWRSLGVV
jgi:hypothetical protein